MTNMKWVLDQGNYKLNGAKEASAAISVAEDNDPVTIVSRGQHLDFFDSRGSYLGTLTARNAVAKRIHSGVPLLMCHVAWKLPPCERYPDGVVSVRIITGDPDDPYVKWCAKEIWGKARELRPMRSYPIRLAGGANYLTAISNCREGDNVTLFREPDNPHDNRAIVAKTCTGLVIGYIPRRSFLHQAVHDGGCGAVAKVLSIPTLPDNNIVLDVTVSGDEMLLASYGVN
jgi:hypothetical protein